ncbi:N-acetyltransferase [Actinokineospora diospyrosa]|uniref:N-acetyltransferase n=1 Tax=Actinokineospora diospyrosa TaxID=103728 RepID=UPI0020A60956|nr:N-acetyltransferase [Actinokineospora diospyrosa]
MDLVITSLAERPDLDSWLDDFANTWPVFMQKDPMSGVYYGVAGLHYPEHVLVAYDRDHPERLIAKAHSVPFRWTEDVLPPGGWDRVIQRASVGRANGEEPNMASALEINIQVDMRGTGLSAVMLGAMRDNARALGFDTLVAPVRPNGKPAHPEVPMGEYAGWTREDGLPVDPWLRVHVRAGGVIEAVAVRSMTIAGTLAEWRSWTGLPFDRTGQVLVPDALVPVHCDVEHDHAVYVEPNVWVRHKT